MRRIVFCLLASLLTTAPLLADTILTYTGNPYTYVSGTATKSMSERATIDIASALGMSFTGSVTPVSFTLFDGITTITNQTAGGSFWFQTDANGNLSGWNIQVLMAASTGNWLVQPAFYWCATSSLTCGEFAEVADDAYGTRTSQDYEGAVNQQPGAWTMVDPPSASNVPEPSSLGLLLIGLALMSFWIRVSS